MAKLLFFQESPLYEALGIHAIAGAVKSAGHTCDVVIESEEKDLRQAILNSQPSMIAFSIMTRQQEWAIFRLNRIKAVFPEIPIIIGGTHPTMYPETLKHCEADYLCVGEGELPIVELLTALSNGERTDNIPNIHAKINGEIFCNDVRPLLQTWDTLAFPDRTTYKRYPFLADLPLTRFITSFGCAYKCSLCYIHNFREAYKGKGKFYRRKSVTRVLEEMRQTRTVGRMERVHFVDDLFSFDKRWLKEFLPRYKAEIGIPWSANVWIDHMDKEMVDLFSNNCCVGVTFGVESGNEETRNNLLDKPLLNATYIKHCQYLYEANIHFHTGNIIGLPGEGLDKAYETARFNRKIKTTSSRAALFWPFPGTNLADYAKDIGVLSSDYSPDAMNSAELINQGHYARVEHKQAEELIVMASLFQAVAKWGWFDWLSQYFLKRPKNPIVKTIALLVEQSFWYSEAKFFGMLNWKGVMYYFHVRKSLRNIRSHDKRPHLDDILMERSDRLEEDTRGQRSFWGMGRKDLERVYKSGTSRDGIT